MLGIPLGVLIGLITGYVLLLLLSTVARAAQLSLTNMLGVIAQLLAIPTFWFGGPWVTGKVLSSVDPSSMLPSYMVSLAITFALIAIWPLINLIMWLGQKIGQVEGTRRVS